MDAFAQKTLSIPDYAVIMVTLVISVIIGIYFRLSGGQQKTNKEYLLGGRDQKMLPVAVSLMASFMSAISLLGVSAEIYMFGTLFFLINFSYLIFTPIAAYLFLPVFFNLGATSAYEYLNLRFGSHVRTCASLIYSLQMVMYMGIVLYAPATTLQAITGLSQTVSIIGVGAVCMFYCTLGGMKAVIWTDVFQSLLMFAAVFSVIISAAWDKGGFLPIWNIAKEGGRIQFLNLDPDPTVRHSYLSMLVGGGFTFLSLYAVNQTQVQRYLTMRDQKTAVRALWLSTPILIVLSGATAFSGLAIYSKYHDCDPILSHRISGRDQLLPLFVVDTMSHIPGMSGLFISGIFCASLSTVSACLNSLAAVTLEDYVKPLYRVWLKRELPSATTNPMTKLLAVAYGLVCLAVAFLSQLLGGVLQAALTIFGMVGGPLLAVFTLGMFCPCANEPGAITGLLSGLVVALIMGFGGPKPSPTPLPLSTSGCHANATVFTGEIFLPTSTSAPHNRPTEYLYLFRVSYLYYVVISFSVAVFVGLIFSWSTFFCGRRQKPLSPDLFIPPIANFLRRKQAKREVELKRVKTEMDYTFSVHL